MNPSRPTARTRSRPCAAALASAALLAALAGCQAPGTAPADPLAEYLGAYRGSFDSALTEDPGDDLNHNPCNPARDGDCAVHQQPLRDVLMTLERDADDELQLSFYADRGGMRRRRPIDLLGAGCGTVFGPIRIQSAAPNAPGPVLDVPITTDNRLCLGKLRPTSDHLLRIHLEPGAAEPRAQIVIDRAVNDTNYLYVVEDGVERRVRIDLDNTITEDHVAHYRVCIEDDFGEYERCVLTDREFRSFALPVPLPGGMAINYTFWQSLTPKLRSTHGRYAVEQYHGHFSHLP